MFQSKQNLHHGEEVEHHSPYVMVWGTMKSELLFGPYFFDGPVNHLNHVAMLKNRFISQLKRLGIESNAWFQQDGASVHFEITVRKYLNEVFPGRWIGLGSTTLPVPFDWPPQSPDLTTCDTSL